MPTEMRILIDLILVLCVLMWGNVYNFIDDWHKWLKQCIKTEDSSEKDPL